MDKTRKGRNEYIDFIRGMTTINIIAIHTAFWAGEQFTPEWFRNLTLLVDVPLFFYLSGWASSLHKCSVEKTCRSLLNIWIKWVFFYILINFFCYISNWLPYKFEGAANFRDVINGCFFRVNIKGFPVVASSLWYMPYYFIVLIVNTIIVVILTANERAKKDCFLYMLLLAAAFVWISFGNYFFGLDVRYFLFYAFFWMYGYNQLGKAHSFGSLVGFICLFIGGICLCSYMMQLPIYNLQSAKFPPSIKYRFASMIIIWIVKSAESHVHHKNSFLVHVGRVAIFYYFGQGIATSLNFFVVDLLSFNNWIIKWILTFVINVILTIVISELLNSSYVGINRVIKNRKTATHTLR